jgi:hypothetical protein
MRVGDLERPMHPQNPTAGSEPSGATPVLTFTPAEWRAIIEDPTFLRHPDNCYTNPRRLLGLPVRIVPDRGPGLPKLG